VGVDLSFLQPSHPQFRELIGAAERAFKETLAALKKAIPSVPLAIA
jgi:hypothetical protein